MWIKLTRLFLYVDKGVWHMVRVNTDYVSMYEREPGDKYTVLVFNNGRDSMEWEVKETPEEIDALLNKQAPTGLTPLLAVLQEWASSYGRDHEDRLLETVWEFARENPMLLKLPED